MKKSQLVEMIRKIVKEEVARQLPGVLSEMYLKKMVSESVQRSQNVVEDFDVGDEEIPEPMQNSDEGIYQQSVLFKEDNPFRELYEGVRPLGQPGSRQAGVPLDTISSIVQRSKTIHENVNHKQTLDDRARTKFEEQRIARYREQLDSKVVK